jgi:perosamine synthetase
MRDFIPLMIPGLTEEDISQVNKVLRSGMLVQGNNVLELENGISSYLNTSHASALSNGTATLHLALLALGIGPGDEVIVPAFSYMATANVVELVGAKPVFVDIKISSFNIDASKITAAITKRTKAIIPVHEFGLPSDISQIMELARNKNLYVIEDAACALGAKENDRYVGSFGDLASFSFHPRKAITSGEGGMLVSNNEGLDKYIKVARNHGIDYIEGKMDFVMPGYNYRMTDFQAALILNQLKRLDQIIADKDNLADIYLNELKLKRLSLPSVPSNKRHTWQTFHIVLDNDVDRDKIIEKLKEAGIGSNYGAQCMPYMRYMQEKYSLDCASLFPESLKAYKQGLALPLYGSLSPDQVKYICNVLEKLL